MLSLRISANGLFMADAPFSPSTIMSILDRSLSLIYVLTPLKTPELIAPQRPLSVVIGTISSLGSAGMA